MGAFTSRSGKPGQEVGHGSCEGRTLCRSSLSRRLSGLPFPALPRSCASASKRSVTLLRGQVSRPQQKGIPAHQAVAPGLDPAELPAWVVLCGYTFQGQGSWLSFSCPCEGHLQTQGTSPKSLFKGPLQRTKVTLVPPTWPGLCSRSTGQGKWCLGPSRKCPVTSAD